MFICVLISQAQNEMDFVRRNNENNLKPNKKTVRLHRTLLVAMHMTLNLPKYTNALMKISSAHTQEICPDSCFHQYFYQVLILSSSLLPSYATYHLLETSATAVNGFRLVGKCVGGTKVYLDLRFLEQFSLHSGQ